MNIKERKLIVYFLKIQLDTLLNNKNKNLSPVFQDFFSRAELIEILEHSHFDQDLEKRQIENLENSELLELIGDDYSILQYYIEKIESGITATPTLSKIEIQEFFERTGNETHYLYEKPRNEWDEYDRSNYYSLLWKHGKTKRVFAIYTSDVEEKDKYLVTTKPTYFFDTEKEAEQELENVHLEDTLNVPSVRGQSQVQLLKEGTAKDISTTIVILHVK